MSLKREQKRSRGPRPAVRSQLFLQPGTVRSPWALESQEEHVTKPPLSHGVDIALLSCCLEVLSQEICRVRKPQRKVLKEKVSLLCIICLLVCSPADKQECFRVALEQADSRFSL
jgi:hypothetical protein